MCAPAPCLPGYDVPRRYATAPLDRTAPLLDAYRAALQASAQAAGALAALALATDAPSATLALARAACDPHRAQSARHQTAPRHHRHPDQPGDGRPRRAPPSGRSGTCGSPIRSSCCARPRSTTRRGSSSPAAKAQPGPDQQRRRPAAPRPPAAQLAAQDLPDAQPTGAAGTRPWQPATASTAATRYEPSAPATTQQRVQGTGGALPAGAPDDATDAEDHHVSMFRHNSKPTARRADS